MSDEQMRRDFEAWFYAQAHRQKYMRHHPAYLAALEAWQAARAQDGDVDIYEDVYEQITDAIEPYVIRQGGNPDAFLPASAVESVHKLLDEALAARSQDGVEPAAHQYWCPRKEEWCWFHGEDHFRNTVKAGYTVRALYEHPPAREQVPSGWQLVPIEPTSEMLRRGTWSGNGDVGVDEEWARKVVYQRMLAASPEPPEE